MPEPIATAFVELRPDAAGFRGQADAEIKQALAASGDLGASVRKLGQTDISATFTPFTAGATAAVAEVETLRAAVAEIPSAIPATVGGIAGLGSAATEIKAVTAEAGALTVAAAGTVAGLAAIDREGTQVASGLKSVSSQFDDLLARNRAAQAQAKEFLATSRSAGGELEQSVRGIGQTDLASTFAPLETGARSAVAEVGALAAAVAAVPATVGGIGGLDTAGTEIAAVASQANALTAASEGTAAGLAAVGAEGIQTATGLRSVSVQFDDLLARNRAAQAQAAEFLATSRAATLAATEEAGALHATAAAQTELGRARAATPRTPLIPAGGSILPLVALFAGVQALGELSSALRVSGNDATTWEGKLRNAGASILSLDVIGAFKALTNSAHEFGVEEIKLIENSPKLVTALKEIGQGTALAKGQLAALESLTRVPAEAQQRVAEAAFGGNADDQLAALREEGQRLKEQTDEARKVGVGSEGLHVALADLFAKRAAIRAQIQQITGHQQESLLAGLAEAVTDATLNKDVAATERALLNEKAALLGILIPFAASAEERRKFKEQLIGVDRQLEQQQTEIQAEIKRHHDAMISAAVAPTEVVITDATLTGSLQAELFAAGAKADLLKLLIAVETDAATREELKNELIAANQQVETIQGQIAAENQRHADAMKEKRLAAHQALIDSFGLALQRTEIAEQRAVQQESLDGQRKAIKERISILKKEAAALTGGEAAQATLALIAAENSLANLNKDAVRARIAAREQTLRDNVTLAQLDDASTNDDRAQLQRLIAFEKGQAHNLKLSVAERRKHLIDQRQAEKELKDLLGETKKDGASFARLSFEFLKTQQGFASSLASNLLPPTPKVNVGGGTQKPAPTVPSSPEPRPPVGRPSPFAPPAPEPAVGAAALRQAGGTGVSSGQGETLIHLSRETLRAIREGNRSNAHPEAHHSRRVQAASMETGW